MNDFNVTETLSNGKNELSAKFADLHEKTSSLLADPEGIKANCMNGSVYVLSDKELLSLHRDSGDSRYPYGRDGFNLWVYASGYMHANEGLLSTFLRAAQGQEPNVAFFAGKEKRGDDYQLTPLFSVPNMLEERKGLTRYTVFSPSAAYFVTEFDSLRFGVRVFATPTQEISFSINIENIGNQSESFFLSSFLNPFLRHQLHTSDEDNWFKEVSLLKSGQQEQGNLDPFLLLVHEDKDRHTLTTNYALLRRELSIEDKNWLGSAEATTSRLQYVGSSSSSLHTPEALLKGTFGKNPKHLCTFTETGIMGDLLNMNLPAGKSARLDLMFSPLKTHEDALALASKRLDPSAVDLGLKHLEQEDSDNHVALSIRTDQSTVEGINSVTFNAFIEHLKKQVEFCSLIKGYIQLSFNSLIGIRDVFQAIEGMLFWRDEAARDKMLEALDFTAIDGRCFRQYSLPPANQDVGRMDLRQFIDQGVWVISTIHTYLRVTQDWEFLSKVCGYHEIVDEAAGRVVKSEQQDSVLEHMLKIMAYLLRNRDHDNTQCSLALYGDWNDALDGLGISQDGSSEFGTGVSVMATLQVYQNTQELIDILNRVDASKYAAEIEQYSKAREEIEAGLLKHAVVANDAGDKRILHGWGDQYSYFVGSYKDSDGVARDGLTSNAFWVLSGLYKTHPEFKQIILDGLERLDSKYGYLTFAPHFDIDAKGVGRIPKLPPGTAENGASYIHATAFGIMALFQMGEAQKAWEQLCKILPFTKGHENLTHSPFVMPNSYGYNPEKFIDGQNMNDWQTGSSNVVLKLLIRFVFGFEPELDGLWIQPAAWCPFESFQFKLNVRGCQISIHYENKHMGERSFKIDDKQQKSELDETMSIHKLWIPNEELKPDRTININVVD
ncbi:MAG: cellobiose phosphorylase [Lentimonas sp.]|jgi:cellobiose phosphorylase